jgi:hypothetical protein
MICASALLTSGRRDTSYRWRNITAPPGTRGAQGPRGVAGPAGRACPGGYAQQLIHVQAIPAGATDPTWLQVAARVVPIPMPSPSPTSTP